MLADVLALDALVAALLAEVLAALADAEALDALVAAADLSDSTSAATTTTSLKAGINLVRCPPLPMPVLALESSV